MWGETKKIIGMALLKLLQRSPNLKGSANTCSYEKVDISIYENKLNILYMLCVLKCPGLTFRKKKKRFESTLASITTNHACVKKLIRFKVTSLKLRSF